MKTMDLRRLARQHYGPGYNARMWVRSVLYLRARGLWVLEGGAAKFHSARLQ